MKKRNDLILIGIFIILAAAALTAFLIFRKSGSYAVVTVNGKEVARYSLSEDKTEKIETIYGYNVITISDGYADVTESDCKNQICVHSHKIKEGGETIVCLPHRLTVTVDGDGDIDFAQ